MPELPEVENIVLSIAPLIMGQTIDYVEIIHPTIVAGNHALFKQGVEGQRVKGLNRRGKYILFEVTEGFIILHLRMTGQLLAGDVNDKHTHFKFHLENGTVISYRDVRKFGGFIFVKREEIETYFKKRLGLEPLMMTYEEFEDALKGKKGPLKKILLEQKILAGIGNIYGDEILFYSGLHPLKRVEFLNRKQKLKLYEGIKVILDQAIAEGGSSIKDYVNSQGQKGGFQDMHRVYGRSGHLCYTCETPLVKTTVGGRTTVYCPTCQKKR